MKRRAVYVLLIFVVLTFFFNEYIIYYVTVFVGCAWPVTTGNETFSHILVVADIHLLGRIRGHWFDKLRREWQMYRSFQSAVNVFKPEAVFFLGDHFDEGQFSSLNDLQIYSERLESLFHVPEGIRRIFIPGNHDIGYHYEINPTRMKWFSQRFSHGLVDLITVGSNYFVLINSMALERDGCNMCTAAEEMLLKLKKRFDCDQNSSNICEDPLPFAYSRPIIMQHFPLFRESNQDCPDDPSVAEEPLKSKKFRETWDCLSAKSTDFLLTILKPRAVFDGHDHYSCRKWWPNPYSFWEWTVPSLSWRNNKQPGMLLLKASSLELQITSCYLPNEITIIGLYTSAAILIILYIACEFYGCQKTANHTNYSTYELLSVKLD